MTNRARSLLTVVSFFLAAACGNRTTSAGVATSEIRARFKVTGAAGSTAVACQAELNDILGPDLELGGGDSVTCSDGTTASHPMSEVKDPLGAISYVASGFTYDPSTTFLVTFKRGTGESFTASISMPPPLVVSAPAANSNHVKGQPIDVAWTAANSDGVAPVLDWQSGSALTPLQPDDGAFSFSTNGTFPASATGTLPAQLILTRVKNGVQPALQGTATGEQSTTISINLTD